MIIKQLVVGPIQANCYIVGCEKTREAAVIDPGDESDRILRTLSEEKLIVKYLLNTHGHFDHVGANRKMKSATNADILIHSLDAHMLEELSLMAAMFGMSAENSPPADRILEDGDEVSFGTIAFKVLHTPGHTPGGVSFYTEGAVFVGDTLFAGSVGRTDLPGGDFQALKSGIQNKLFTLEDNTKVYPGHMDETTIGLEKSHNPYVRL